MMHEGLNALVPAQSYWASPAHLMELELPDANITYRPAGDIQDAIGMNSSSYFLAAADGIRSHANRFSAGQTISYS